MKLTYRPEIDGLRAIAVGAVIFYHAQITILGHYPFKGGFIGVDIFFVISGYLITSIILKELITTNSFSFKHFYQRRIRRILPVLLFVMMISLPFAWIYLLPSSFIDFSKSILYSLGFSSNFYFHYSGQIYGAESGLLKPFLHTWSLSVEEQYYIIFPIVLLVIFKYFRKYIIHILIFGFFISLGLADWGSRNHLSFNFYMLPTRVWELLAGSILAYFEINNGHRSKNKTLNLILPMIGLLLIGHSILFFNDKMFHPSFYTLSPIIGVCLIIWFSDKNELITKILSTKLFVGVGLISYSLYLWHYPIFAFNRLISFSDNNIIKETLLAIIILVISVLSYLYIEVPYRKKNDFKKLIFNLSIMSFFLMIMNLSVIFSKGLDYRFENIYFKNVYDREILREKSWFFVEKYNEQRFNSDKLKILIVGDSHSKDLFNAFVQNNHKFKKYEFVRYGNGKEDALKFGASGPNQSQIYKFTSSKLFYDSDYILISDNICPQNDCFKNLNFFIKKIKDEKKILLTSLSPIFKDNYSYKRFTKATLFDYILLNTNKIGYLETFFKKKYLDLSIDKNISSLINKTYFANREEWYFEVNKQLKKIANENNISFLNKEDFQCENKEKKCYGIITSGGERSGLKVYYDYGHYTLEGARFFGKIISDINWLKIN